MLKPLPPRKPGSRRKPLSAYASRCRSNGWIPTPGDPEDELNFYALRGAQDDGTGDIPTKPGFYTDVLCGAEEYDRWLRRFSDKRPGSQIVKIGDRPGGRWDVCEVTYNIVRDFREQYAAAGRAYCATCGETYEEFIEQYITSGMTC